VTEPFEEPRKIEMREQSTIAIDAAGYEQVASPVAYNLSTDLTGAIKGDLQSLDGEQIRQAYYLRPDGTKPIPQWLANIARAALELDEIKVFVVVTEVSSVLEKSCRACGMGLLLLTEERTFELVLQPGEMDAEVVAAAVVEKVRNLRRRMENKLNLKKGALESNYARVDELTTGMDPNVRDQYIEKFEQAGGRWDNWGARISEMLDEAVSTGSEGLIEAAAQLIEQGAEEDTATEDDASPGQS
jgi:hypothetical protein